MGGIRDAFSGTTIKDTWTKPRWGGSRGGRWGWLGWWGVVGGKCRQLYLNNNKIILKTHWVLFNSFCQSFDQKIQSIYITVTGNNIRFTFIIYLFVFSVPYVFLDFHSSITTAFCVKKTCPNYHFISLVSFSFFKKDFIYVFLDRGEGREKERERNISVWLPLTHPLLGTWPATQAYTLTGSRTGGPLVHRPVLNPLSHTSQGISCFFYCKFLSNFLIG